MTNKDTKYGGSPFHAEIRRYEGGFEWTFYCDINGAFGRRKIFKLKFDRWWLIYLAKDIKKVLDEEQKELDRLNELAGFKDDK